MAKLYEKNMAGFAAYIASERAEAEKVLEKFRADVADEDTYILWALRRVDQVIYAGVLLRRLSGLESQITRYNNVIEHKIDGTNLIAECGGELTEQSFLDNLVNDLTKRLAEAAKNLNSGLESQAERNADLEILARFVDEAQYRWWAKEEVTA